MAKGLFYWYFETKEQVFRDLADDLRLRLRRAQAAAMDPRRRSPRAAPPGLGGVGAVHGRPRPVLRPPRRRERRPGVRRGHPARAPRSTPTTPQRIVRAGIDAGLVRDEDPRLLAYSVLATVGWFAHCHRTGPPRHRRRRARRLRRPPGGLLLAASEDDRPADAGGRPRPGSLNAAQQRCASVPGASSER